MEIADLQPLKGHGSYLTQFGTSQLLDHPFVHLLTDRVAKLEGATDTALITVTAEVKVEVGRLESRLTTFAATHTTPSPPKTAR